MEWRVENASVLGKRECVSGGLCLGRGIHSEGQWGGGSGKAWLGLSINALWR